HDYEHPFVEIDGALRGAFDRFDLWRVYIDPQWIDDWAAGWRRRFGEQRVFRWYTNRPRPTAWAVRNYTTAVGAGDLSHDGDELLAGHIGNAHKRQLNVYDDEHRQMHTLAKEHPDSRRKIDGAIAGVLSWEARGGAIAAGADRPRRSRQLLAF